MAASHLWEARQMCDDCLYTDTLDQRALLPFKTVFSGLFRLFRAFPAFRQIQAAPLITLSKR